MQPSAEDSVKVMTIHAGEGPGVRQRVRARARERPAPATCRSSRTPPSAASRSTSSCGATPRSCPTFEGELPAVLAGAPQARRSSRSGGPPTSALTRARRRLCVTGAHWYGEGLNPKKAEHVLRRARGVGQTETGRAEVGRPTPSAGDEPAPRLPRAVRARLARAARCRDESDPLFPDGWRAAAAAEAADGAHGRRRRVGRSTRPSSSPSRRRPSERRRWQRSCWNARTAARRGSGRPQHRLGRGLIDYARARSASTGRPFDRCRGSAARRPGSARRSTRGSSGRASGQATLLELDEAPDLTAEELAGEPGKVERLQRRRSSRAGSRDRARCTPSARSCCIWRASR